MKVIRNLEISAGEFLGAVFEELAAEVKSLGNADFSVSDFKAGFAYIYHPEDPALKVTFEIVEYQEDRLYKAVRASANGTITVMYEIVPNETGITVTFTYINDAQVGKKKSGIFAAFSELLFLGRMTDKLYGLQRSVINTKEGFTEKKAASPFLPDIRKSN